MKRRGFLKGVLNSAGTLALYSSPSAAAALVAEAEAQASDYAKTPYRGDDFGAFSIIQGITDATSTQLNVTLPKCTASRYRLIDQGDGRTIEPSYQNRVSRDDSDWSADNMGFEGLALGRDYTFEVYDDSGVLDRRRLKTADLSDSSRGLAIVSCANDQTATDQSDSMWDALIAARPSMTFFIGDNVYGCQGNTSVDPKELWRRYVEVRQLKFKFYHSRDLIPTVVVWDDHDFGSNNGDGTYRYKWETVKIFDAMYAQRNVPGLFERGPGAASWYRAFGIHFQLMDSRFYKRLPDRDGNKSQWGAEGDAWLESTLAGTDVPVFLFNGTMFFGTMPLAENYQVQFNKSFDSTLKKLSAHCSPVVFLSGDVHWSEIQRIPDKYLGYETYEIVSSGIACKRTKLEEALLPIPNPWRLKGAGAYKNLFTIVTPTDIGPRVIQADVAALTYDQQIEYCKSIRIER